MSPDLTETLKTLITKQSTDISAVAKGRSTLLHRAVTPAYTHILCIKVIELAKLCDIMYHRLPMFNVGSCSKYYLSAMRFSR
jgi:hypothetical protein